MNTESNQIVLPTYFISHGGGPEAAQPSAEFDAWLSETVCESSSEERSEKLNNWSQAASARAAHPREDHLIPLMVAVGAAEQEKGVRVYHEDSFFGGITVSNYRFGTLPKPEFSGERE